MESYTKSIKIKFDADEEAYKQIKKNLTDAVKELPNSYLDAANRFADALSTGSSELSRINSKFVSGVSFVGTSVTKAFQKDFSFFNDIFDSAIDKLGSIISNGLDELSSISKFSTLSDTNTRDLAFTYGFNAQQAYGFSKAMEIAGFATEEDLQYGLAENGVRAKEFKAAFEKYTNRYSKLYDEGTFDTMLELDSEMKDFEEEMKLVVVDFVMQNKDTIKKALQGIIDISDAIIKFFNWEQGTTSAERMARTSDIIASHVTNHSSNTKVDITFNNTAKADNSYYAHAGQLVYEQVIRAMS